MAIEDRQSSLVADVFPRKTVVLLDASPEDAPPFLCAWPKDSERCVSRSHITSAILSIFRHDLTACWVLARSSGDDRDSR